MSSEKNFNQKTPLFVSLPRVRFAMRSMRFNNALRMSGSRGIDGENVDGSKRVNAALTGAGSDEIGAYEYDLE